MSLPERAEPITNVIISNYGLKLIAAQANYNAQPLGSAWGTVERMKGNEIKTTVTMGRILDYLGDPANPQAEQIRSVVLTDDNSLLGVVTVGMVVDMVNDSEAPRRSRSIPPWEKSSKCWESRKSGSMSRPRRQRAHR